MRNREVKEHRPLSGSRRAEIRMIHLSDTARDRFRYLLPSRYFRFYMVYERESGTSCWIPEGFLA